MNSLRNNEDTGQMNRSNSATNVGVIKGVNMHRMFKNNLNTPGKDKSKQPESEIKSMTVVNPL